LAEDALVDGTPELVELEILLTDISEAELDAQPFGLIQLDRQGRVLAYNLYEEDLARKRRQDVIGKSFFFEVAPCTRVRAFYGRFLDGVARGALRTTFGFHFTLPHGDRRVTISLIYRARDETVWVVVRGG
jgi:photoactive yellow protein